ncbi:MAG: 7-cyano-7-deazaguanine synthase QueC [Prevotella sp.]|nr:7-cyano-7-deazaguanine synthase QueC [Prevotella sp.]
MNNKDALLILSGGIDSTTMLYEYAAEIALAVSFDYGSNHNKNEIAFARRHCARLAVEHLFIPLDFVSRYFSSSLLSGADAIPDGNYDEDNMRSTVVPFRNGIMLSVACGIAESRGLRRVMMANHAGDHTVYPDCRPEFVAAMDKAMQEGTWEKLHLFAPYTNLTKTDIVRRGAAIGVDYGATWSCYKGRDKHCGVCGTCRERKEAFAEAGVPDPTDYAE